MNATRAILPSARLQAVFLLALFGCAVLTLALVPASIRVVGVLTLVALTLVDSLLLGLGSGWFAGLLARHLWRRDRARGRTGRSLWYRDLQAEADAEQAQFHRDTEDNPTVR